MREFEPPPRTRLSFSPERSPVDSPWKGDIPQDDYTPDDGLMDGEDVDAHFSRRVAALSEDYGLERSNPGSPGLPTWARFLYGMALVLFMTVVGNYKLEASALGYCDAGTTTNAIVQERIAAQSFAQECRKHLMANTTEVDLADCSALVLAPLPHPVNCTPCPEHATCTLHTVTCKTGYVPRPHPLTQIPLLSDFLNGLPPLGSVALPPTCVLDGKRRKTISTMGRDIESVLASKRGDKICTGSTPHAAGDGGKAREFGVDLVKFKETLRKWAEVSLIVALP